MFYEAEKHSKTGTLSSREMVSMNKNEVVGLMTDFIVKVNIDMAMQQGIPDDRIDFIIDDMLPSLNTINADLYDLLVDNGVIA